MREGVRQECLMSPTLFMILLGDIGEEMKKEQTGEVVVKKEKFLSLEFAHDIVLVATSEGELNEMIRRFERFLDRKKLVLSEKKSKMMVFKKEVGRRRKSGSGKRKSWKKLMNLSI